MCVDDNIYLWLICRLFVIVPLITMIIVIADKYELRRKYYIKNWFLRGSLACDLCTGFWLTMLVCFPLHIIYMNATYLLIPFLAATLIRRLL